MPRVIVCVLLLASLCSAQSFVALPKELPLHTQHGARVSADAPRAEYPRPDLVRERWLSLNGIWEFSQAIEGPFEQKIRVPFAPECALSGLFKQQEILERCRYRRGFQVPDEWRGQRILLHCEAVDWEAQVLVDGHEVGTHRGGYDRFTFDITDALARAGAGGGAGAGAGAREGKDHALELRVFDPADPKKTGFQPRGKQLGSHGIWYTRTTGIWRSVWLEPVPPLASIEALTVQADHEGNLCLRADVRAAGHLVPGWQLRYRVSGKSKSGEGLQRDLTSPVEGDPARHRLPDVIAWTPKSPVLYDLEIELRDQKGEVRDRVRSYVGFRTVAVKDGRWSLNGAPYFLLGVLDQGYWPEGGLTAPSDEALRADVQLVKDLGLNLARKHVKVEDARWYFWCDQLGVLVMQDLPSSMNLASEAARENFRSELTAIVTQLRSHSCVAHWVAFNEDWGRPGPFQDECVKRIRTLDATRPVTDASGWTQREDTDLIDVHDYGADLLRHGTANATATRGARGKLLGECGGVAFWLPGHVWSKGWGYTSAKSAESFVRMVHRLAQQAHVAQNLSGFVWTQLSDVEQELNGFVHYDRTPKVETQKLARALSGNEPLPRRIGPPIWHVLGPLPAGTSITTAANDDANRRALAVALEKITVPDEASLVPHSGIVTIAGSEHEWQQVLASAHAIDLLRVAQRSDSGQRIGATRATRATPATQATPATGATRATRATGANNCVCYASALLRCDQPIRARLLFGSDDAAQIWINGELVHKIVAVRGCALGQDEVEAVDLKQGENLIVVKVAQGIGGFGMALCFEPW